MAKTTSAKTALAKKLGISRSTLYYKPKRPASDEEKKKQIMAVMSDHKAYGSRRVAWYLNKNRKGISRIMQKFKLKPLIRRGAKPAKPDDLNRPESHITNILKVLCPIQPNIVWAGDFTYLWFKDRFWYLATVIDIFTREILGWHLARHHTTNLIIEAFKDAARRQKTSSQYFHSDQGSEYVAGAYESLLEAHGTTASHSRKASPWQNGYQESFYSQFKLELGTIAHLEHVGQLIELVAQQLHYYNHERIHSAHKMAPAVFRQRHDVKTKTTAFTAELSSFNLNPLPHANSRNSV